MNAPKMLEEIYRYLEQNKMGTAAEVFRERIKTKENSHPLSEDQIMDLLAKSMKGEGRKPAPLKENLKQKNQPVPTLTDAKETRSVLKNLMHKMVAKPSLIADDTLNGKIERMFNNALFQRMVERADIIQDMDYEDEEDTALPLATEKAQEQFIKRVAAENKPPPKDEEELPHFGAVPVETIVTPAKIKEPALPPKNTVQKPADDSFGAIDNSKQSPVASPKKGEEEKMPSVIISGEGDSGFVDGSQSIVLAMDTTGGVDEYTDDDDPGFVIQEVPEEYFERVCKELAEKFGYPARSIKPEPRDKKKPEDKEEEEDNSAEKSKNDSAVFDLGLSKSKKGKEKKGKDKEETKKVQHKKEDKSEDGIKKLENLINKVDDSYKSKYLPGNLKYVSQKDEYYPVEYDGVVYDTFNLKMVFDREKTGFEETKEFPIVINSIVAGRYQILDYLGSAAFSKAIQCQDLITGDMVCMKIIENNKDYFDQSVDEIKLLKFINANGDPDKNNVLKMLDYFYHKEHLIIVTELLKDNLYEYYKYNRENEETPYFTLGRLQKITKQILAALNFIHSLHLIHCDLKPENILIKSYSRCEVKVIDFGSSCFIHDHLSSYVQSRSYRAPEVILGYKYDYKIDIWSLGCILAELYTGNVIFQNDSVQGLLARVVGIMGPIPERIMKKGRQVANFFTREGLIYQEAGDNDASRSHNTMSDMSGRHGKRRNPNDPVRIQILLPKKTTLKHRLGNVEDEVFIDFIRKLLEVDPDKRPTAKEAMAHPWLTKSKYPEDVFVYN